jgi:hypothetical protein
MKGKLVFLLLISLFLGFVLMGVVGGNIYPAIFRISAPLVCKDKMVIESRSYSYKPGSTSVEHKVYCQEETSGARRDITFAAIVVSCLIYSGIIFLVFCANMLVKRLRGGASEGSLAAPEPLTLSPGIAPAQKAELPVEDPAELLKKLKELRQSDLITEQEYEAKKAEILSKM